MRLATFNLLHGRTPADGVVDLNRLIAAVRDPGRRHPGPAGGGPGPAALPSRGPDRGRRRGHGGRRVTGSSRRSPVRRARPGSPRPDGKRPARPRTGSPCCPAIPPGTGRSSGCRGSEPTFPLWLPDPRKWIVVRRGAASGRGRPVRHPGRTADRGQHPPLVRARLATAAAAAASAVILLRLRSRS